MSDIWEGGHREPTIISYPRVIRSGSSSNHMVSLSDLYCTLAELTGAELEDHEAEDSVSNSGRAGTSPSAMILSTLRAKEDFP